MAALRQLLVFTAFTALHAGVANAGVIDLRLEVNYANGSSSAGGDWQLFAKSDELGLFSLRVPLSGINAVVDGELPVGRVNGSATNNAGFSTFLNRNLGSTRELFFGQTVTPGGAGQQGLFYGVGTLSNGSPFFPGRQSGTRTLGPDITTLTSVQGVPWATEDSLWATGVTVASGEFAAGLTPSFSTLAGAFEGSLFDGVGTIAAPGSTTSDVDFTTLVVTNLDMGLGGDFNSDGTVDLLDLDILGNNFGAGPGATRGQGDGNGDGNVDLLDLDILGSTFGQSVGSAASIPEPGSLVMLVLASIFVVGTSTRSRD